jgi:hypothetical protein
MAYADLTPAQKDAIQNVLTPIIRPSVGEMRRVVNLWKQVGALWGDNKSEFRGAMAALVAADMIPNTGGLAGAGEITRAELVSMIADMAAVVATWEDATRLGLCVRLAGINAE